LSALFVAQIKTREQAATRGTRSSVNGEHQDQEKLQRLVSGQCLGAAKNPLCAREYGRLFAFFLFVRPAMEERRRAGF
jgi:hypothetical protein